MQKRSLLVQVLLDMATGGATLEELVVDRAGTFDAGVNKGYNPVIVPSGGVNIYGEKSNVTNHSVVVTPKVQVSKGWVNDGESAGSGVGVTASELVDGTYNVSQAGSADVTNYKNVSVKSGGTTSSIDRTTVDAHTVRFTPKATVAEGWQGSGTVTGESVDVNAGELVSGTYPVTESGEFDVSAYEKISVPSGSVSVNAVKGMVANHSVLVTPSGNRSAGFISSGTTQGQAVRVDASELVSGTLNVASDGVQDVTNYESISVPSGGHSASATKGTVNNHSVNVTPKSTATAGFVSAGTVNGTPVSVSASELVSGTLSITESGTFDVTNYERAAVNISSGATLYFTYYTPSSGYSNSSIRISFTGANFLNNSPKLICITRGTGTIQGNNIGSMVLDAVNTVSYGVSGGSGNYLNTSSISFTVIDAETIEITASSYYQFQGPYYIWIIV